MSLRAFLTRQVYLPLSARLQGERMHSCLRALERSQWEPAEVLGDRLRREVFRTVAEAARQIPFYRDYPRDLSSWEDFLALPLLSKAQVRDHFDLLRLPVPGESLGQTSGSTGAPLRFAHGPLFRSRHEAGQWRARGWFGVRPGDAVLAVWGRPVGTRREWALLQLKSFLNHILHVSAFELDPASIRALLPRIRALSPRLVYGYPSGLAEIAKVAEELGVRLDDLGVRVVGCTAEVLYGFQRDLLERVFGAPVADVYGCGEFGAFSHQCPQGGMHVACENVLVEFLDEAGRPVAPGEPGEVVVTGLHNPGMPLIRYRVGDVGSPLAEPCACGRGLPRMDVRAGKAGQMVRTTGGRMFSTELFDYVNKSLVASGVRGIGSFHVVQTRLDGFTVRYSREPGDLDTALRTFEQGMREVLGAAAVVRFEEVPGLARHPGGKMGYFSCEWEGAGPPSPAPNPTAGEANS